MAQISPIRKFVNPELVYGIGALGLAGQYARSYGARRLLVVSDPGVIAAGWTGRVITSLDEAGMESVLFSAISPNPRESEVMCGAELYGAAGCDAIVVIGGGSPMDCAKGIGIVSTNNCHILECEGVDRVVHPMPPLICIPTTAGSAADVSQFAIITNSAQRVKIAIISKSTVPDVALIDPQTTTTMDAHLTTCTGMDALVHAMEAYVSNASSPLTDLHALQAVRLISSNLVTAITEPSNLVARDAMMLASLEAGLAFSNASLGAVHAMAHSLGGFYDLPHGECNSMLLDHVVEYNFPTAVQRYRDIAAAMGIAASNLAPAECLAALTGAIRKFRAIAGITTTLTSAGVMPENIPALAQKAMKDACMVTNPRRPTAQDIKAIYEKAL